MNHIRRWLVFLVLVLLACATSAARTIRDEEKDKALKDQQFDLGRLGIDADIINDDNAAGDGATDQANQKLSEKPKSRLVKNNQATDGDTEHKDVPNWDDTVYDQARLEQRLRKDQPPLDDATLDEVRIDHRMTKEDDVQENEQHRQLAEDDDDGEDNELFEDEGVADYTNLENKDEDDEEDNSNDHPSDAFAAGVLKDRRKWNIPKTRNRGGRNTHQLDAGALAAAREANDPLPPHIPVITVVAMTIAMAGAAGLGALPFFFVKKLSKHWSAVATAIACGVMFAASFDLIHEGQPYGPQLVILGIFLGGVFIRFMQKWLDGMEEVSFGHLHGNKARRLVLMVGIMAAHAIGEGCGVGVSFCGDRGWAQGVLTTLAIGVHNVPEGLAKATVLVSQGASAYEALFWSVVTCLPQPLVAVPSFIFVETFTMLLPTALGFAAGCMIWMVFAELLPEALEGAKSSEVASAATLSAAALEGIRMGFEALEGPAGAFLSPFDDGDLAKLVPALAEVAPAIFAAALATGIVSGSSLPTPVVVCFSAAALAVCGIAPLATQIVSSSVPILHTVSATVAGMAAILLLRRYTLQSLIGGGGASSDGDSVKHASTNGHSSSGGMKTHSPQPGNDLNSGTYGGNFGVHYEGNNGYSNGAHYAETGGGGSGGGVVVQRARGDHFPLSPESPSKMRGGAGLLLNGHGSSKDHGIGRVPRRLAAPALAAGVTVLAALVAQGVALGWHFTRELVGVEIGALTLVPAMAATLALHGVAAGGALRAVVGKSIGAGGLVGVLIGVVPATSMLISYYNTSIKEAIAVIAGLSYPVGWTETLSAAACGALCMAALLQVAVAMSINPKHARFGLVLGVLCFGVVGGLLTVGCVAGNEQTCAVINTFLM